MVSSSSADRISIHTPRVGGDKVYNVLYDDETDQHIVDEQTVTEVGINGVFVSAAWPAGDDYGDYLPYTDLGDEWFLSNEDAYKERDRREDNEQTFNSHRVRRLHRSRCRLACW